MMSFLLWLDADPSRYWNAAFGALIAVFLVSLLSLAALFYPQLTRSRVIRWLLHPLVFCALVGLALFAFRWPAFFYPRDLNPDESAFIAQAMRYQIAPIPWRDVDAGTSGPLNQYSLLLGPCLGLPLGYLSARIIGALCVVGIIIATYLTLRRFYADAWSRLAVCPLLCFFALTMHGDLVHYSSEHVPILLLSVATCLLAAALGGSEVRRRTLFLAGVVLGAAPLAKLQAVGPAVPLFAAGTVAVVWRARTWLKALQSLGIYIAGGMVVPFVVMAMVAAGGALPDFWQSFVVGNLNYSHPNPIPLWWFFNYSYIVQDFDSFLKGILAFLFAGTIILFVCSQWIKARFRRLALISLLYLFGSVYAVLKPGATPGHYLLFVVHPLALLAGLFLAHLGSELKADASQTRKVLWAGLLALLYFSLTTGLQFSRSERAKQDEAMFVGQLRTFLSAPLTEQSQIVLSVAKPGDRAMIWGDMPGIYVETHLPPATRDVSSVYEILDNPSIGYYRRRLLEDMLASKPDLFVDATVPGASSFQDRRRYGHETLPELRKIVDESYVLVAEDHRKTGEGIRVYRRKE